MPRRSLIYNIEKRSAYRLTLSYKGDTLGEHMHAWPQDITRADREGRIGRAGYSQNVSPNLARIRTQIAPDENRQPIVDVRESISSPSNSRVERAIPGRPLEERDKVTSVATSWSPISNLSTDTSERGNPKAEGPTSVLLYLHPVRLVLEQRQIASVRFVPTSKRDLVDARFSVLVTRGESVVRGLSTIFGQARPNVPDTLCIDRETNTGLSRGELSSGIGYLLVATCPATYVRILYFHLVTTKL